MSMPVARAGAGMRLLRTAVFTAVCVVLAAAGHGIAAGVGVPGWTLLAGLAGVFAVTAALAGRERTLLSITAALAAGQLALHILFGLGRHTPAAAAGSGDDSLIHFAAGLVCGAGPAQLSAGDAHRIVTTAGLDPATVAQGHTHLASAAASDAASAMDPTLLATLTGCLPSLPMFLGHLLAALATGWLLRRGEIALFRLARLSAHGGRQLAAGARLRALRAAMALVRALRAGLPGRPTTGPRPLRSAVDAPAPATGDPLQHMVIRRGPPPVYVRAA
uniref:Integral membrane protein n=1 Tax=Streptomyces sp. NBC_01401 TaxID=2903854 RepID=A0AAU3GVU0_9ACTN